MQFEAHSTGSGRAPGSTEEEVAAQAGGVPSKEVHTPLLFHAWGVK